MVPGSRYDGMGEQLGRDAILLKRKGGGAASQPGCLKVPVKSMVIISASAVVGRRHNFDV